MDKFRFNVIRNNCVVSVWKFFTWPGTALALIKTIDGILA